MVSGIISKFMLFYKLDKMGDWDKEKNNKIDNFLLF